VGARAGGFIRAVLSKRPVNIMKNFSHLALFGALSWLAISVSADEIAAPPVATITVDNQKVPSYDALLEPALQIPLSFEVKSLPLSELLAQLQKQSGVIFKIADEPQSAPLRVTARANKLPLAEVMRALRRLYGVSWTRDAPTSWTMSYSEKGALERELLRFGEADNLQTLRLQKVRERHPDWLGEVFQHTDDAALNGAGGVSLSVLPVEMRARLRADSEANASYRVIEDHLRAQLALIDDYRISFEWLQPRPTQNAPAAPYLQVLARSADGKIVTPLGDLKPPDNTLLTAVEVPTKVR
ncbi:MAG: hypothetical protein ACR2GG_11635, partial [Gemmatimonadaceae bacterium]